MKPIADLELGIHRQEQNTYAVDFSYSEGDPASQADVGLGAREQALIAFDLDRLNESQAARDWKEYGQALTAAFFSAESLRTGFAQARAAAGQSGVALRIRLSIAGSALELHPLHWELLNDPHSGLALSTDQTVFFSRYLSSPDWRSVRLRSRSELSALVAIAAPSGLDQYKLAEVDKVKELDTIKNGLGEIHLRVLEQCTLTSIVADLTKTPFDILYLVAHGTVANGEPYLWLEDEGGNIQRVKGEELVGRVRELDNRPRLVILASCQSAGRGEGDVLAALGPRLAEVGVPAVLAMQDNLRMDTSARFMPLFFSELQKDGLIDRALAVARGLVREQPDWWVPALFMRLKSGRLWYTPGFGGPSGEFEKWPSLLSGIQSGRCTPILGPGLTDALMGSVHDLAQQWADELQYPLASHERESLPQVAQYRAVDQSRVTAEDEWMALMRAAILRRVCLPDAFEKPDVPVEKLLDAARGCLLDKDAYEPHKVLAQLPAKVYITANPDELLEAALIEAGRKPKTMVCPWRDFSEQTDPAMYTRDDVYDPCYEEPLVYHLFGLLSQPESLVLTEDDTFEFLIGITRHMKNIPDQVGRALADSALLFLGFQTDEWSFRVLLQALLSKEGNSRLKRYAHIAAQIEPEEGRLLNPGRARRYLEHYFSRDDEVKINIYWGTPREFMKELASRLPPQQA